MKKVLLLLVILASFGLSAQTITTTPADSTSSPSGGCNGTATFNPNFLAVNSSTLQWAGGGAIIQNGGFTIDSLCIGSYTVSYYDSLQAATVTLNFTIDWNNACANFAVNLSPQDAWNFMCNGSIDVAFSGGTAPYTAMWSNGTTTYNQTNLCAGCYTGYFTDAQGCTLSQTACVADTLTIIVYNQNPGGTPTGNLGTVTIDSCITFFDLDPNNVGATVVYYDTSIVAVQWELYDTNGVMVLQTIAYYPLPFDTVSGLYDMTLELNCSLRSEVFLQVVQASIWVDFSALGIFEDEMEGIKFINPFTDFLNVQMEKTGTYEVSLINLFGQKVLTDSIVDSNSLSLATSQIAKGTYLLQVKSNTQYFTSRVIKY